MTDVMSSEEIQRALLDRWSSPRYLHIPEAPEYPDRAGRRCDVLIVDSWRKEGLHRIGIEIKRSIGDYRAELRDGDKATWWCAHVHEFWVAAPDLVARRIELDGNLPKEWGLLSVAPTLRSRTLSRPAVREPEPLEWASVVGVLRAASGLSSMALQRARDEGYRQALAERSDT